MKTWMRCAAAMLLCATSARAEDPNWSIGAGITYGFGELGGLGASAGSGTGISYLAVNTFSPSVSIERRVAPGTWLLLGAEANYSTSSSPIQPNVNSVYFTSMKQGGFGLAAGVRQFLTGPGAVIGVSLQVAAQAGIASVSEDLTSTDGNGTATTSHASSTGWTVGAIGGFALDRQLIDQLTLRLGVQLLSASFTKSTTSPSDTVQGAGSSFAASLIFSPDLELRFAF